MLDGREITTWSAAEIARGGLVRTFQDVRLFPALRASRTWKSPHSRLPLPGDVLARLRPSFCAGSARASGRLRRRPFAPSRGTKTDDREGTRDASLVPATRRAGGRSTESEADELVGALAAVRAALGIGLLVIEHDMRVIMGLSERIQVLDHGRTIAIGTPAQVRGDPAVRTAYLGTGQRAARDS